MRQKILLGFAAAAALSMTGCRSGSGSDENEALRQQITQLEQQINDLQDQISSDTGTAPDSDSQAAPAETPVPPAASSGSGGSDTAPASAPENEAASPAEDTSSLSTTRTMEELAGLVSDYEAKADAAVPNGSASADMEQFLSLKQEEKEIDDQLDLHEDELEYLYRNGSLSREDYKAMERELERLEDRLDDAEDKLEYTFGIDD